MAIDPIEELMSLPINPRVNRVAPPTLSDISVEREEELNNRVRPTTFRLPYMTYDNLMEKEEEPYSPEDFTKVGQLIRDNVVKAIEQRFPVVGDKYTLKVENVHYEKPKLTSKKEERETILKDSSLMDRLKGDWVLYDNATGKELQRKGSTLLNVPRMTSRGTFIRNGSELGLKNMFRLRPGVYTRIKNNGEVAAHINPAQTTGRQMSINIDAQTGAMSLTRGTRTYGILPILRAAGMDDEAIKSAWGNELFKVNDDKYGKLSKPDSASALEYKELWDKDIAPIKLDEETTQSTLGKPFANMDPEVILRATQNVLKVSRSMSEDDTDDRDSLQYQRVMGPADYIPERIVRDGGGLLRNMFNAVTRAGNLDPIPTGAFQDQVDSVFMDDKHAGYIDGASPMEALDFACSISRLGEGGIGDVRAAPAETRGVNDSYAGFIDPIRSPESLKVGLDVYLSYGVKKDSKGRLYNYFKDRTGKSTLVPMDKVAKSIVATPEFYNPKASPNEYVPAFMRGKGIEYVQRKDVDYYIDNSNRMLSIGAGMIPLIGGIRSNRTLMGCLHPDTKLWVYYSTCDMWVNVTAKEFLVDWVPEDEIWVYVNNAVRTLPVQGVYRIDTNLNCYELYTDLAEPVVINSEHKWEVIRGNKKLLVKTTDLELGDKVPYAPEHNTPSSLNTVVYTSIIKIVDKGEAPYLVDIDVDDNLYMLGNGLFTHNSKYANQAVPLRDNEAPFVQRKLTLDDGSESTTEQLVGRYMGAQRSPVKGRVISVNQDEITIRGVDGQKHTVDLYNNFPANQKGFITNTAIVKPGDIVSEDQVLAKSNYTDNNGTAALGKNLRVAFMSGRNASTFEDAIAISESCAKKLASEQLYKVRGDTTDDITYSKEKYLSLFKNEYTPEQLAKIGDDGLPIPGAEFKEGDPVYLGVQIRPVSVHGVARNSAVPYTHIWGHSAPGTVTDVVQGKKHLTVYTKAYTPMEVGDKMCFDYKTEVLTDEGWKFFKDLNENERVFTLDIRTGETWFATYSAIYKYEHKGKLYSLVTKDLDMRVTADHNLVVTPMPDISYAMLQKAHEVYGKRRFFITGTDVTNEASFSYSKAKGYKEEWVDYDGIVYCITVPGTHILYTRRNGKNCWSGNSARYGGKGVVSEVIPDDQMPQAPDGQPYDVLQSPLGLPSRLNTAQLADLHLGEIARRTGSRYILPDFLPDDDNIIDYVDRELKANNVPSTEDVYDPVTGKTIPGIETGTMFFYKLKHMAELKERGRSTGDYSAEEIPLKGEGAARRFGALESSAVYSGGGEEVLRDAKILRGQRNDQFWRDFRDGKYPDVPGIPLVHKKFFAHLQAAGVKLEDRSDRVHMYGATDQDMKALTGNRKVQIAATFDSKDMRPVPGGLFDPSIFGADGDQWGYVDFPEPVLNPLMFKTVGSILGWKDKELTEYLEGSRHLKDQYGTDNLMQVLDGIDLKNELKSAKEVLKSPRTTLQQRDMARKKLRAIEPMLREGKKPTDFFLTRMPILPPRFRPVTAMAGGTNIAADANFLYKRMIDAIDDVKAAKENLPEEFQLDARKSLYNAVSAVTGLTGTDDPKLEAKGIGGVLKWAFGKGSPKLGSTHRKVFGANLDLGSLGTIVPDNGLDIDECGIPEKSAWKMFEPFVVRKLTQNGYSMVEALRQVVEQTPEARQFLIKAMDEHPILLNRAPTLWRYGIMGSRPKLIKDNAIHVNPSICKVYNADFDGDSMTTHVPVSQEAIRSIEQNMLPSRTLLSPKDYSAHFIPRAEMAQGLFLASRTKKDKPVHFRTEDEMLAAYKRGEIKVDTPVTIG